jgi:hypothetical protein
VKYQLLAFGPGATNCVSALQAEFRRQFTDIGLDPSVDSELVEVAAPADVMNVDWGGAPVGIWFGDIAPFAQHAVDLVQDLLKHGDPVFPVCDTLLDYSKKVPSALQGINGQAWREPQDKTAVVADVLGGFRLTPRERTAFISYRRDESRAVAVQIFEELQRRKYAAFLDTASVAAGVSFQEVLTGRLSGVDLVVFLDTPTAVSSQWVYQELNQAQTQGMGILQVLWPGRAQAPGTGFCDAFPLRLNDFVDQSADKTDTLVAARLRELVQETERTRIRSIRHRRERVIAELMSQASHAGMTASVYPVGTKRMRGASIELTRSGQVVGRALPVLGLPNSMLVHNRSDELQQAGIGVGTVRLVYDELGIHPSRGPPRLVEWASQSQFGSPNATVVNRRSLDG